MRNSQISHATLIMGLIGRYGTIKLRDLEDQLQFFFSDLQRICIQSEELRWVRRLVSNKAYVLTFAKDDFFQMPISHPLEWITYSPCYTR
tara:strand:- start:113 stop:382 length:270 start_codon:yes stop_codon:yes gene_type:complete